MQKILSIIGTGVETLVAMRGSFSPDNHLRGGYIRRMPCIWDFDGLNPLAILLAQACKSSATKTDRRKH